MVRMEWMRNSYRWQSSLHSNSVGTPCFFSSAAEGRYRQNGLKRSEQDLHTGLDERAQANGEAKHSPFPSLTKCAVRVGNTDGKHYLVVEAVLVLLNLVMLHWVSCPTP